MKKIFLLIAVCMSFALCACSASAADESSNNENTAETTEVQTTEEPPTEEPTKLSNPPRQTPGEKTFEISSDDIVLLVSTGPNPTDPRFVEVHDPDTKVKVYNMLKNAVECEPIDYDKYEKYYGSTQLYSIIRVAGGAECRIYLGNSKSENVNLAVQGQLDGEAVNDDYLLDEEFASEFYKLLGKE